MGVQVLTSPSGDQMVVLPKADYDALVAAAEDAVDLRAADEVLARIATGEEEVFPADFVDRFLDERTGRVAIVRAYRGFDRVALAATTGIEDGRLAAIEADARIATPAERSVLATTLAFDPAMLFPE
jgi:hypothetical protein